MFFVTFPTDESGVGSAGGSVVQVVASGHVWSATRYSEPPTGAGSVTYRRSAADVTTSVPTPVTVTRSRMCFAGALSTDSAVAPPKARVGWSARTKVSATGPNVRVRGAAAAGTGTARTAPTRASASTPMWEGIGSPHCAPPDGNPRPSCVLAATLRRRSCTAQNEAVGATRS